MTEETLYQQLAELKLQNRLLNERLTMMTRMCNDYMNKRADVCGQLDQFDLAITADNKIMRKHGI